MRIGLIRANLQNLLASEEVANRLLAVQLRYNAPSLFRKIYGTMEKHKILENLLEAGETEGDSCNRYDKDSGCFCKGVIALEESASYHLCDSRASKEVHHYCDRCGWEQEPYIPNSYYD